MLFTCTILGELTRGEKLYANLKEISKSTRLIKIRGKAFNYGPKMINVIYGLLDHDIKDFKDNGYKPRNRLASKLCLWKNVTH